MELNYNNSQESAEPRPYSPSNIREVTITPLDYGFIIRVGCQQFAIESTEKLILQLSEYLRHPAEVSENWFQNKVLPG